MLFWCALALGVIALGVVVVLVIAHVLGKDGTL